ncbi:MAG: hypothetical protein GYA15_14780 [Leptolinea sp.]|jgi:hypothetical protein|nr:hypothetical protein [Leptolinea sp.]
MNFQKSLLTLLTAVCLFSASGCNAPVTPQPAPTVDVPALKQEIYSTLVAQLTADAPKATATPAPTATAEATATPLTLPTLTQAVAGAVTSTPQSTFTAAAVTRYPTWTKTPYTDSVVLAFQSPGDGTVMAPGQDFDVKWTFRNNGKRKWTNEFFVTYYGGYKSNSLTTMMLPAIGYGEEYTFIADFTAPTAPGNYVSYWRMYNDDKVVIFKFNFAFSVK